MLDPTVELGDLHIHVGGAVAPHVLWSIAHEQGFKLPVQTYWEFCDLVSATPNKVSSQEDYLAILHQWTEKIQSSPAAIERSVHEIVGKEFRSSRVTLLEIVARSEHVGCSDVLRAQIVPTVQIFRATPACVIYQPRRTEIFLFRAASL